MLSSWVAGTPALVIKPLVEGRDELDDQNLERLCSKAFSGVKGDGNIKARPGVRRYFVTHGQGSRGYDKKSFSPR